MARVGNRTLNQRSGNSLSGEFTVARDQNENLLVQPVIAFSGITAGLAANAPNCPNSDAECGSNFEAIAGESLKEMLYGRYCLSIVNVTKGPRRSCY